MKGNLYATVPPAGVTGFPLSPVIKINTRTGEVTLLVDPIVAPSPHFDFPTSLAYGNWFNGKKSLFVVGMTSRVYGFPGSGPKVTEVGTGEWGRLLQ